MKVIKAIRLNDENFKDYGWTMRKPGRKADVENDQLIYWDHCADLPNFTGNGLLGFLEVKRIPIELTMMDLLTESIRIYLSVDGKPSVQFVALNDPQTNAPDLSTLQAFVLENGDGVVIKEGVWHWTPFALSERACFAMGLRNDIMAAKDGTYTVDETKVKYFTLEEPVGISF